MTSFIPLPPVEILIGKIVRDERNGKGMRGIDSIPSLLSLLFRILRKFQELHGTSLTHLTSSHDVGKGVGKEVSGPRPHLHSFEVASLALSAPPASDGYERVRVKGSQRVDKQVTRLYLQFLQRSSPYEFCHSFWISFYLSFLQSHSPFHAIPLSPRSRASDGSEGLVKEWQVIASQG